MSKRIFDISVTLLASVIWAPVYLVCAIANLVFEGLPVHYSSDRRVGDSIRRVVKFRTMVRNAEQIFNRDVVPVAHGIHFLNTPVDSPLYTRTGRVIERLSLTELPQVFHVLSGYMSLVGNRPLPENVVVSLLEDYPDAQGRFTSPAGIAGPVQLVGRSDLYDHQRLLLEMAYCRAATEAYSWRLDLLILINVVLVSAKVRKPFTVDEAMAFVKSHADLDWNYPEELCRRVDDGAPRDAVWTDDQRQKFKGNTDHV